MGLVCYIGSTYEISTTVEEPIKLQHIILIEVLACNTFNVTDDYVPCLRSAL